VSSRNLRTRSGLGPIWVLAPKKRKGEIAVFKEYGYCVDSTVKYVLACGDGIRLRAIGFRKRREFFIRRNEKGDIIFGGHVGKENDRKTFFGYYQRHFGVQIQCFGKVFVFCYHNQLFALWPVKFSSRRLGQILWYSNICN
jgi:hypothetical protein